MADYFSATVLTAPVLLNESLYVALTHRQADIEVCGEAETVLDGLVHEREPLCHYTVVWPTGWLHACDDADEFFVEYCGLDDEDIEQISDEVRRLVVMEEQDLLHEILKINPDLTYIEMQEAHTCSRMRLDGYSGSSIHVTRKGFMIVNTRDVMVSEEGEISFGGEFIEWGQEPWKEDEDVEAA